MDPENIPDLFDKSVKQFSDNIFLWEKRNSHYKGITYQQTRERLMHYAAGLLQQGIQKGDRVALISEGRNDWVISELAVLYLGAICVPLSVKIEDELDLDFRLAHSQSKAIIISGNHQKKAFQLMDKLPFLEFVILLDGKNYRNGSETPNWESLQFPQDKIIALEDLLVCGQKILQDQPQLVIDRQKQIQADDYANICYTSGTTADPKGIILSHRNYLCNVEQASAIFDVPEYYTSLHILPWDHSFAHTVGIYALMRNGASLASLKIGKTPNETLRNIPICIQEVRPYFLLSVPALAKNFRKNIEKAIREKGLMANSLFKLSLKTAYAYNREGFNKGKGWTIILKPLNNLFDLLLFKKIRANFGGRLRFFVGGGALLDIELQRFFYAIGMPMFQGYGLTEAAPIISSNTPMAHKLGSSGKVVPWLELKICDDQGKELPLGQTGEIVVKGDNVMPAYWGNETATAETIRQGWLYTGDLGYLDQDGYLFVKGRNKSLLIANDGEKYSPEGIEEAIMEKSAFIEQIVLYNNQNHYTSALLFPAKQTLKDWALKAGHNYQNPEGQATILKKLQEEINRFLPGGEYDNMFPSRWLPSAIYILTEGFTEQNKLLNSTMKMVRPAIYKQYQPIIDFLYTPEAKDIKNQQNCNNIKTLLSTNGQQ